MQRKHNHELVANARTLRKNMTKEERRLWFLFLRGYPVKFLRQKPFGNYIADFYCAKAKLIIELDGSQHYTDENLVRDKERTAFFEQYGVTVLRIPNKVINEEFRSVCEYIDWVVTQRMKS